MHVKRVKQCDMCARSLLMLTGARHSVRTLIVEEAQHAGRQRSGSGGCTTAQHISRAPRVREVLGAQQSVCGLKPALPAVREHWAVLHAAYVVCAPKQESRV